ncbi:ribosome maturation factor RimM [Anabaena sp. UHCC 0451]|uniref:ribosome maturation factor RimM n=1 Tax=Anabaena sp. UHCC 0451 TaxID=2055235 RepID=UPI002B211292|nr:ribosome maturation factor RimM [Anabaena sp. UHCC 0451]MEA5575583.1 ribosome maturation factor RimM [Anabaena sp. UHCC 0451]
MNQEGAKKKKQGSREQGAGEKKKKSPVPSKESPVPNLDDWLEIGKIVAPQGLAGEVRVYPNTDFPERFEEPGTRWLLRPGETEPQPIELLNGRYIEGKNLYVIRLDGVSDRTSAENMRDCRLFVPISDRLELEPGEFHVLDLLGLQVFMQESGELVGTVVDVLPSGHDLLEVKFDSSFAEDKAEKTVLIPFVMDIVPVVDLENHRVEITPPPGLLSIND